MMRVRVIMVLPRVQISGHNLLWAPTLSGAVSTNIVLVEVHSQEPAGSPLVGEVRDCSS